MPVIDTAQKPKEEKEKQEMDNCFILDLPGRLRHYLKLYQQKSHQMRVELTLST